MAIKLKWGSPLGPKLFTSKTGKPQTVGYQVLHDTGKTYPAHGKRAAEKAAKRKAKNGK